MKLWKVMIQDGENYYYEYMLDKPIADYVDGFMRAVKSINEFTITKEEVKILTKFGIV